MKLFLNPLINFLLFLCLSFLACNDTESVPQKDEPVEFTEIQASFSLETFTKFPKDIDGCSCYFAKDSLEFTKKNYLFVDNFEDVAYVKMNSEMIRLTRIKTEEFSDFSVKSNYASKDFKLIITIYEGNESGEETWMNWGEITIEKNTGEKFVTKFYGECGC